MFKAKVIENDRYYKLIRYQMVLMLLLVIPYVSTLKTFGFPGWSIIIPILIYVVVFYFIIRNNKAINQLTGYEMLEIDDQCIRLVKTKTKEIIKWDVREADAIVTNKEFHLPNDKFPRIFNSWKGDPSPNFLELKHDNQKIRLEFRLDSSYMLIQMKKIVESWISKGIQVERK